MPERESRTRRVTLLIVLVCLLATILLYLCLRLTSDVYWMGAVRHTKTCIGVSRVHIGNFARQVGRFPISLSELNSYIEGLPADGVLRLRPAEFITNRQGNVSEHRKLDNQGGLYYCPTTGEIKVNLTEPVKHYRRTYIGGCRDEVPADW